jgi:hypothetical protein
MTQVATAQRPARFERRIRSDGLRFYAYRRFVLNTEIGYAFPAGGGDRQAAAQMLRWARYNVIRQQSEFLKLLAPANKLPKTKPPQGRPPMSLRSKVLLFHAIFWALVMATLYFTQSAKAEDGGYGIAGVGRSEYPLKAFDQVSMDNAEQNQATALSVGFGYRRGLVAAELSWYDFGSISIYGHYAAEPGHGAPLDYSNTTRLSGSGAAKGLAATALVYPFNGPVFLRGGVIHAKSSWTVTFEPLCTNGVCTSRGPAWAKPTVDNYSVMGAGFDTKTMRVEWIVFGIQPHGDSAYGKISTLMLTFKF